jgi:hypothetical protein
VRFVLFAGGDASTRTSNYGPGAAAALVARATRVHAFRGRVQPVRPVGFAGAASRLGLVDEHY